MELEPLGAAPHDGNLVLLLDEVSGAVQLARWSKEANGWTTELGDPLAMRPTHWVPSPGDRAYAGKHGPAERLQSLPLWRAWGLAAAAGLVLLAIGMASLDTTRQLLDGYSLRALAELGMLEDGRISSPETERQRQRRDARAVELASAGGEAVDGAALIQSLQADAVRAQQTADATIADHKRLLHEATIRSESLERELAAAQKEIEGVKSAKSALQDAINAASPAESEVERHRYALESERQNREELAQELASARAEVSALRLAADLLRAQKSDAEQGEADVVQELRSALANETKRADHLASALTTARDEIARQPMLAQAAQAASAEAISAVQQEAQEQREAVEAERTKAGTLGQDLASTRLENEALARDLTSARENIAKLKHSLDSAAQQHQQKQDEAIVSRQSLERELAAAGSEKEALSREVDAARVEIASLRQKAEEYERAFRDETRRADLLAREVESAKRERAAEEARPSAAAGEPSQEQRTADAVAEHKNALERGPEQIARLERAGLAHSQSGMIRSRSEEPPATVPDPIPPEPFDNVAAQTAPVQGNGEQPLPAETKVQLAVQSTTLVPTEEERLIALARTLLGRADIGSARAVLHHMVNRGSAKAAFILAETYDSRILRVWQVQGVRGDPAIAREMYQRAAAAGLDEAKERLQEAR